MTHNLAVYVCTKHYKVVSTYIASEVSQVDRGVQYSDIIEDKDDLHKDKQCIL